MSTVINILINFDGRFRVPFRFKIENVYIPYWYTRNYAVLMQVLVRDLWGLRPIHRVPTSWDQKDHSCQGLFTLLQISILKGTVSRDFLITVGFTILTYLSPLFMCWSIFANTCSFDFVEIFAWLSLWLSLISWFAMSIAM